MQLGEVGLKGSGPEEGGKKIEGDERPKPRVAQVYASKGAKKTRKAVGEELAPPAKKPRAQKVASVPPDAVELRIVSVTDKDAMTSWLARYVTYVSYSRIDDEGR